MQDRPLPQHHRQRRARLRAGHRVAPRRPAAGSRVVPDHPGVRHPAHAGRPQAVRRDDDPGRGRDRRRRRRARGRVRRGDRRDDHLRSWPRAQGRDDRPGHVARAAPGRVRHPARRPLDRPADQDRAGRPAAGDVRPQRRVAGRDRRAEVARRLLRHRHRGGAHRDDLHDAGAHPLRRLPRQRVRAVVDPARSTTCRSFASSSRPSATASTPTATTSSTPTCATPRRWPARGPSPARRDSSTASAASRRPTSPATSPTTPTTTTS